MFILVGTLYRYCFTVVKVRDWKLEFIVLVFGFVWFIRFGRDGFFLILF